jgi:DNA-binding CsgD family transcriptional regulator
VSEICSGCGRPMPKPVSDWRITDQELNVLSAWWLLHSTRAVARFFGVSEQTIKNQLMNARRRHGIHSTTELAQTYMARLRTMEELTMSHKLHRKAAA